MKNINKIFGIVTFGALALTSCDDSFLSVPQYDKIDIKGEFLSNEACLSGLTGVYDLMNPSDDHDPDWGFKPNLFSGTHPTMDTQATGWDAKFNSQQWDSNTTELASGWTQAYAAIARANLFLSGLANAPHAGVIESSDGKVTYVEGSGISDDVRRAAEGEARALRAFFYTYLAQTFGRVPMLDTNDDYTNSPEKARAENYNEMWDFIIQDLEAAEKLLDWTPYNHQYGRATKGMAKAYLADAYMWKAYRLGCNNKGEHVQDMENVNSSEIKELYKKAEKQLSEIIESGTYKLNPAFCTNWDVTGGGWNSECIWAEILDEGENYTGYSNRVSSMNIKFYTACPENGGWGSLYLSWEWYAAYEQGDKRRDASCIIGAVPYDQLKTLYTKANKSNADAIDKIPVLQKAYDDASADLKAKQDNLNELSGVAKDDPKLLEAQKAVEDATKVLDKTVEELNKVKLFNYGYHPFLQVSVGNGTPNTQTKQFHFTNGEYAPAVWSSKFWRNASAANLNGVDRWGGGILWSPTNIYWKRYSNVLLDYAECRFVLYGGDDAEGWAKVQEVRDRAFGKMEAGLQDKDYIPWLNKLASIYKQPQMTEYPIPFNRDGKGAPDAKQYYTEYAKCNIKGNAFESPVWKVAVNEERRKEFSCEWCLRPDMQRSGYIRDHIETNYPKDSHAGAELINYPWSPRTFDYNEQKMDMPIPADEIAKNPSCDQNPAYK